MRNKSTILSIMPQFSVDSRTIDNVIGYINNGQISIPEIQRPFVWDGSKIRDLIDSLYPKIRKQSQWQSQLQ